jgi:hypothetical protein
MRRSTVPLIVLLMVLVGCGGGTRPTAGSPTPKPTLADVATQHDLDAALHALLSKKWVHIRRSMGIVEDGTINPLMEMDTFATGPNGRTWTAVYATPSIAQSTYAVALTSVNGRGFMHMRAWGPAYDHCWLEVSATQVPTFEARPAEFAVLAGLRVDAESRDSAPLAAVAALDPETKSMGSQVPPAAHVPVSVSIVSGVLNNMTIAGSDVLAGLQAAGVPMDSTDRARLADESWTLLFSNEEPPIDVALPVPADRMDKKELESGHGC